MDANSILQAQQTPISSNDIVSIQNSLLDAATQQRQAEERAARQAKQLSLQQINNANNAAGTLFSTRPTFQGTQQVAGTYIPAVTKSAITWGKTNISTRNTVADALKKIQAYNEAANQLNAS